MGSGCGEGAGMGTGKGVGLCTWAQNRPAGRRLPWEAQTPKEAESVLMGANCPL